MGTGQRARKGNRTSKNMFLYIMIVGSCLCFTYPKNKSVIQPYKHTKNHEIKL